MTDRFYGRNRDHHDPRDYIFRSGTYPLTLTKPSPTRIDVCAGLVMPEIFDQLQEGSCTANAWTRFMAFLAVKFPQYTKPLIPMSRQAFYYWERALPTNNDVSQDNGANMRDGAIVGTKIGFCPEPDDPYGPTTLYTEPSAQAVADAAARRFGAYHRIVSLDDMKGCLLSGYPFVLGFTVYASFESIGSDGIWNPDVENESVVGGHATFCRGFDDKRNGGCLIVDNSWSPAWGRNGSFLMPYSFIQNYSASQWDTWTAHLGPKWVPKTLAA